MKEKKLFRTVGNQGEPREEKINNTGVSLI